MNHNFKMDWEEVISAVVFAEERFGANKGSQKRRWAVQWLLNLINIPGLPRWAETWIFSQCVDLTVHLFNRLFTHQWKKRVRQLLATSQPQPLTGGPQDE